MRDVSSIRRGDQRQEAALRVPRAVNMVDGLPRACKSIFHVARLFGATAAFKCKYLADRITEFAEDLSEPSLDQKRPNGSRNSSSLFPWREILADQGPEVIPKICLMPDVFRSFEVFR